MRLRRSTESTGGLLPERQHHESPQKDAVVTGSAEMLRPQLTHDLGAEHL